MQTRNKEQSTAGVTKRDFSLGGADVLLLDNCPGHPSAEELCTNDGEVSAMFQPSNKIALIQPMDQNVIQNIKQGYRKFLLTNNLNDPVHNENLENNTEK
ncbi:hypothetical protein AVEN_141216-1, partial [Araneus ventricosus]